MLEVEGDLGGVGDGIPVRRFFKHGASAHCAACCLGFGCLADRTDAIVGGLTRRGMEICYGSMEVEEEALEGKLEQGAANGGAAPREGEQVVAAITDVPMSAIGALIWSLFGSRLGKATWARQRSEAFDFDRLEFRSLPGQRAAC